MKERSFGSTLRLLRERSGLSVKQVVAELEKYGKDITDKALYSYENYRRAASADMFLALCQIYNCSNILEMFAGIEPDYSIPDDAEWKIIEKYRSLDSAGQSVVDFILDHEQSRVAALRDFESRQSNVIEFDGRPDVPARYIQFFQKVSAGSGQIIEEDLPPEQIAIPDIPEYRRVAYAVMVSGRSMEPLFQDGDMLLIEPACAVDIGEIGIFNVDGNAFVKKCGETELISLNTEYENIPLTNESRCMGKVVDRLREQ